MIEWYRARWEIEVYFHVIKNGCQVEALQLSAIDRIERALAFFMVVAWRVTYMMRMGRTCPDLDAALFFDPDEIRDAHLLTKKKVPALLPDLNEIIHLIAQVGGLPRPEKRRRAWRQNYLARIESGSSRSETLRALRDGLG